MTKNTINDIMRDHKIIRDATGQNGILRSSNIVSYYVWDGNELTWRFINDQTYELPNG